MVTADFMFIGDAGLSHTWLEHAVMAMADACLSPEARLVRDGADLTFTQRYVYAAWLAGQLGIAAEGVLCSETCWKSMDDNAVECLPDCPHATAFAEYCRAADAAEAALAAWLASDEPHEYKVHHQPVCGFDREHAWHATQSGVGGDVTNPAVQQTETIHSTCEVCCRCGRYRFTETYQDTHGSANTVVSYEENDEESQDWRLGFFTQDRRFGCADHPA